MAHIRRCAFVSVCRRVAEPSPWRLASRSTTLPNIGDAEIGANSSLVAPVTIGDRAYIGSGSVITKDVPDDAMAIERSPQNNREGAGPTHLTDGLDIVTDNVTRQAPVNALVEEDSHDTVSINRSFASSRKAMTCSRVTDGNPSRKSSIASPASR